jgi:serine/threonine-protein kinase
MGFQIGDTVGDYQIIGLLGAGGMGKVYKVKNTISDRIDALKVLLPDLAEDPELADRFTREIKVLASLNHPNIAGLRTAFRLENQLLMVMEFVEGTTLDERTKAGPIPLEDAISYITQVLAALGYAHKRGVIHRDIKPANMMLTPDNVIKLMDFGIAKSKSDKKLTQTGTTMGSLFYMSAEQVQGGELDGRSDLYSVGVSLYELVTGTRPFQGKSDFDIMVAQLQQTPMAPIQMMPNLPRALNDIIMISLEKDPGKRFQTAEAFAAALGSITQTLQSTPVQASFGAPAGGTAYGFNAPPAQASATGMLATQTTPGPQPPAASGYIPTANMPTVMAPPPAAPPSYIPTGPQATMMPPPPMAPPATMLPATDPSHGVPAPPKTKSYAGLYMTLGALIVVAVLAVAAVEGTRFLKARAGGDQTAQSPSALPTAPTPDASATQATGAVGAGSATPAPVASAAANTPLPVPATQNPTNRGGHTPHVTNSASQNAASNSAAGGGQVASTPPPAGGGQAAPSPAVNNAANAQELARLADLHDKLSVRAITVNQGVENMRKQMQASGNNLRSDIAASQTRMKMNMDQFDKAMNAGDPVAANKYMSLAEREVENLEKFLGL